MADIIMKMAVASQLMDAPQPPSAGSSKSPGPRKLRSVESRTGVAPVPIIPGAASAVKKMRGSLYGEGNEVEDELSESFAMRGEKYKEGEKSSSQVGASHLRVSLNSIVSKKDHARVTYAKWNSEIRRIASKKVVNNHYLAPPPKFGIQSVGRRRTDEEQIQNDMQLMHAQYRTTRADYQSKLQRERFLSSRASARRWAEFHRKQYPKTPNVGQLMSMTATLAYRTNRAAERRPVTAPEKIRRGSENSFGSSVDTDTLVQNLPIPPPPPGKKVHIAGLDAPTNPSVVPSPLPTPAPSAPASPQPPISPVSDESQIHLSRGPTPTSLQLYEEGIKAMSRKDFYQAAKIMKEINHSNKIAPAVFAHRSVASLLGGDPKAAAVDADKAIKVIKGGGYMLPVQVIAAKGLAHMQSRHWLTAGETFLEGLELFPSSKILKKGLQTATKFTRHARAFPKVESGKMPVVKDVMPNVGEITGGTLIELTGTDMGLISENKYSIMKPRQVETKTRILIGGAPCTKIMVLSDSKCVCVTPKAAFEKVGIQPVVVEHEGLRSKEKPLARFTYVHPEITHIFPNVGPIRGKNTIQIQGMFLGSTAEDVKICFGKEFASDVRALGNHVFECEAPVMRTPGIVCVFMVIHHACGRRTVSKSSPACLYEFIADAKYDEGDYESPLVESKSESKGGPASDSDDDDDLRENNEELKAGQEMFRTLMKMQQAESRMQKAAFERHLRLKSLFEATPVPILKKLDERFVPPSGLLERIAHDATDIDVCDNIFTDNKVYFRKIFHFYGGKADDEFGQSIYSIGLDEFKIFMEETRFLPSEEYPQVLGPYMTTDRQEEDAFIQIFVDASRAVTSSSGAERSLLSTDRLGFVKFLVAFADAASRKYIGRFPDSAAERIGYAIEEHLIPYANVIDDMTSFLIDYSRVDVQEVYDHYHYDLLPMFYQHAKFDSEPDVECEPRWQMMSLENFLNLLCDMDLLQDFDETVVDSDDDEVKMPQLDMNKAKDCFLYSALGKWATLACPCKGLCWNCDHSPEHRPRECDDNEYQTHNFYEEFLETLGRCAVMDVGFEGPWDDYAFFMTHNSLRLEDVIKGFLEKLVTPLGQKRWQFSHGDVVHKLMQRDIDKARREFANSGRVKLVKPNTAPRPHIETNQVTGSGSLSGAAGAFDGVTARKGTTIIRSVLEEPAVEDTPKEEESNDDFTKAEEAVTVADNGAVRGAALEEETGPEE